jgi:hypothetical protein
VLRGQVHPTPSPRRAVHNVAGVLVAHVAALAQAAGRQAQHGEGVLGGQSLLQPAHVPQRVRPRRPHHVRGRAAHDGDDEVHEQQPHDHDVQQVRYAGLEWNVRLRHWMEGAKEGRRDEGREGTEASLNDFFTPAVSFPFKFSSR